jgi:hypothetical protein
VLDFGDLVRLIFKALRRTTAFFWANEACVIIYDLMRG